MNLWRGSLLPLGCEAAPKSATAVVQTDRIRLVYDCFAAERDKLPRHKSPRGHRGNQPTSFCSCAVVSTAPMVLAASSADTPLASLAFGSAPLLIR